MWTDLPIQLSAWMYRCMVHPKALSQHAKHYFPKPLVTTPYPVGRANTFHIPNLRTQFILPLPPSPWLPTCSSLIVGFKVSCTALSVVLVLGG